MSGRISSWSLELAKLYLLYMAAGVSAIPAGIAYSLIAMSGWERWWTVAPLLGISLWVARAVWKFLEKRLLATAPVADHGPWAPATHR